MALPNPFQFAASDAAADTVAASIPSPLAQDAAATPFDFGAHAVTTPDEAVTPLRQEDVAVDLSCIGEIFAGAARLDELDGQFLFELDPGNQKYRGMRKPRLDVAAFMLELDERPLFLRQVG